MVRKILIVVMFFLIIWFIGLVMFSYQINNFDINMVKKTDAIVVLTGGRHRLPVAFAHNTHQFHLGMDTLTLRPYLYLLPPR